MEFAIIFAALLSANTLLFIWARARNRRMRQAAMYRTLKAWASQSDDQRYKL
jgi:hypothetical protein